MPYLILKKGVYIQAVLGSFDDKNAAIEAARNFARTDVDSHHNYEVLSISENSVCQTRLDDITGHEPEVNTTVFSTDKRRVEKQK